MPIYECSRCNDMTYSSSTENVAACQACGAQRSRLVGDAATFAAAKQLPRAMSFGDHSIAVFDDPEHVAAITTQFIDQALLAGGLVWVAIPPELEDLVHERMHPDDEVGIFWEPPSDTYGPTFGPEQVIARFREIAEAENRPIFVVGCADEPIQGFTSLEGWLEYERMAHEVAVEYGMTVLCLYDARIHDERMLRAGLATHTLEISAEDGTVRRNEAFHYEPPGA